MTFFDPGRGYPQPDVEVLTDKCYGHLFPRRAGREDAGSALERLRALAEGMAAEKEDPTGPEAPHERRVPAAYTYLGQFIDHDVTFASPVRSPPVRTVAGRGARNLRTPSLDLDCLYGLGPRGEPHLYERAHEPWQGLSRRDEALSPFRLRVGTADYNERVPNPVEPDLARGEVRLARLGTRLDRRTRKEVHEVLLVPTEAHPDGERVDVLKADVQIVQGMPVVRARDGNLVRTRRGWQRADPRTVRTWGGRALIGDPRNDENVLVSQLHLAFIRLHNRALAETKSSLSPQEAFLEARREVSWHYQWLVLHDYLRRITGPEAWEMLLHDLLEESEERARYRPRQQPYIPLEFALAGFRFGHAMVRSGYQLNELPGNRVIPLFVPDLDAPRRQPRPKADLRGQRILPDRWTVQWDRFLSLQGSTPQLSRRLGVELARPMATLRVPFMGRQEVLPFVTLARGHLQRLAHGQTCAANLGVPVVETDSGADPLWYYVLLEAQELGGGGCHLGPVGARIVAETLVGLVRESPDSYFRAAHDWRPRWGRHAGDFDLQDLLTHAEAPLTREQVEREVFGKELEPA